MKNFKLSTSIASAALAALMTAGVCAADVMPINDESHIMPISEECNLFINDAAASINAKEFGGNLMLPLRSICESLGMNVSWDGDTRTITIEKLPVYITCTPDADGYTFAKTAPQLLGSAPVLDNGTTYVPMNFAQDILGAALTHENGVVSISTDVSAPEAAPKMAANEAVLTAIGESDITVYDFNLGEVVVNITDETVINDVEGNAIEAKDIPDGSLLQINYAEFMTMSLPPITNAAKIKIKTAEQYEILTATVAAVEANDGYTSITIGDKEEPMSQTVLNLAVDSKLADVDGSRIEHTALTEGSEIIAAVSTISTRSLPPQRNVYFARLAQ